LLPPLVGEPLGFAEPEFVDETFVPPLEDEPLPGLDEELLVPDPPVGFGLFSPLLGKLPFGFAGPGEELFGLFPPLGFTGPEEGLFPPVPSEFVDEPFVTPFEDDPLSGLDEELLVPDTPVGFAGPEEELFPPVPPEFGLLPPLLGELLGFAGPEFVGEPFVSPLEDKPFPGLEEELLGLDPPVVFGEPDEELLVLEPPEFGGFPFALGGPLRFTGPGGLPELPELFGDVPLPGLDAGLLPLEPPELDDELPDEEPLSGFNEELIEFPVGFVEPEFWGLPAFSLSLGGLFWFADPEDELFPPEFGEFPAPAGGLLGFTGPDDGLLPPEFPELEEEPFELPLLGDEPLSGLEGEFGGPLGFTGLVDGLLPAEPPDPPFPFPELELLPPLLPEFVDEPLEAGFFPPDVAEPPLPPDVEELPEFPLAPDWPLNGKNILENVSNLYKKIHKISYFLLKADIPAFDPPPVPVLGDEPLPPLPPEFEELPEFPLWPSIKHNLLKNKFLLFLNKQTNLLKRVH
jgi:hypothetical protein